MAQNVNGIALVAVILFLHVSVIMLLTVKAPRHADMKIPQVRNIVEDRVKKKIPGFTITAYCPGSCCNGEWAGLTVTGKSMEYYTSRNINIAAVDPKVIPLGSRVLYDGIVYHAVDIGGKIKGKRVDILMPDHAEADRFGVRKNQPLVILNAIENNNISVLENRLLKTITR